MRNRRHSLLDWAAQGHVQDLPRALALTGVLPFAGDWRRFLDRLLLWMGTLLLVSGLIFFFAYNWADLHRFAKFALVEIPLLASLGALWWLGLERMEGRAALFGACLLVGALLALIGQTYQTGADTFELFATWAALILPWVVLGRFAPLWLFWVLLLNLAVAFWFQVRPGPFGLLFSPERLLWLLFALNSLALLAWEWGAARGLDWLQGRWGPRLLAIAGGGQVTALAVIWAAGRHGGLASLIGWLAWLGIALWVYRYRVRDLFVLAGGVLSVVLVVAVFLGQRLAWHNSTGFLLVGLLVIGLSAAGAWWLKRLAAEEDQ